MAYSQNVTPSLDPYVYQDGQLLLDWYGWCLATVETAFGTPRLYPSAWEGWLNTEQRHEDREFPVGVYFPIWFSGYSGYGHVAICFVDGDGSMNIWTSPYQHVPYFYTGYHSVDQLAAGYGVSYVGWSEDLASVRLIQPVPVEVPPQPAPPEPVQVPEPAPPTIDPVPDPIVIVEPTDPTPPPVPVEPVPQPVQPSFNLKKLLVKAAVTFGEAFAAAAPFVDGVHKLALAGAIGAGLSAAWNLVIWPWLGEFLNKESK